MITESNPPNCVVCRIAMDLISIYPTTKNRRYECPICGGIQTIYGDGIRDTVGAEDTVIEDVKKFYTQQERNNT